MIRNLRRWWGMRNESRIHPRLRKVLYELGDAVPELEGVRAIRSGHRGHDSTYYLEKKGQRLAVLRLNNPLISRPVPVRGMPFLLATPAQRIVHELAAYQLGADMKLTPQPLWHTHDALVCRYVPYTPIGDIQTARVWELIRRAARAISSLHSIGLTHMDISPNNILINDTREYFTFIDFEYTPVAGLSIISQRTYDHLRLLESFWKFMPPEILGDYKTWLSEVIEHLGPDHKQAEMDMLAPALSRILKAPGLGDEIRKHFSSHKN